MEKQSNKSEIATYIDHTLLRPDATFNDIQKLTQEAIDNNFFSVCINPFFVPTCAEILKNSNVKVCTVIGFPLGSSSTSVKAYETSRAIKDGADEIDMVINIGALKSGKLLIVEDDIVQVVEAAKGKTVKVILETSMLTNEEIIAACKISEKAGAHFVKTSTGFGGGGASIEHVNLMSNSISNKVKIKASGGIRDLETAMQMIAAGANRLGTSSGVKIVQGQTSESSY